MSSDIDDETEDMVDSSEGDYFLEEFERAKKQKTKEVSGQSDYINCNFVTGSAAILESLWSMCSIPRGAMVCRLSQSK